MDFLMNEMSDDVFKEDDVLQTAEQTLEQASQQTAQEKNTDIENSPIYDDEIGSKNKLFDLNTESILKGILFSEILGKPKSKRLGR